MILEKIQVEEGQEDKNQYKVFEIVDMIDDKDKPVKVKQQVSVTSLNELENRKANLEKELASVNTQLAEIIK